MGTDSRTNKVSFVNGYERINIAVLGGDFNV